MAKTLINEICSDLDFHAINEKIMLLENIFSKYEIYGERRYKEWLEDFKKIYGKEDANLRLYTIFSVIYFFSIVFITHYILNERDVFSQNGKIFEELNRYEKKINLRFKNMNIGEIQYFTPILSLFEEEGLSILEDIIYEISNNLFQSKIKPEYIFDYLIQRIISTSFRHKSGEYYTPPFLVKKMIEEVYHFGESVLDPCCGSGNFLVGIIKAILSQSKSDNEKLEAINKISGFDINPISIYLSKINLFLILPEKFYDFSCNLYVTDFLFQKKSYFKQKFDLIIGNPPWYTYRDVGSIAYQQNIKLLAETMEIKPRPKNILNLEISTLFFAKANCSYLKNKGQIFFVLTKGVITGSHASRFRTFSGFSDLKIWMFEKVIEDVFNIDFICLYARNSDKSGEIRQYEIPMHFFIIDNEIKDLSYFDDINLKIGEIKNLVPFSTEQKGEKIYVNKLISKEQLKELLPIKNSPYKKLFHKGADLNPRNLIFVKLTEINEEFVKVNPDERIFKRAKDPWNKREFKDEIIEKKYTFKAIKSTELVKFHIYDYYNVFLPLSREDLSFKLNFLGKQAKRFYNKINKIYLKNKKETTLHNDLMDNLNRWAKLINGRQIAKIKVIYNNSGSVLNSAVVQGDFLITGDLSFFATENLDEAFYLSAILNSPLLTKQIRIVKSSRHIFKLPLDFPIQKYDENNSDHQRLVNLGKKGQTLSQKTISSVKKNLRISKMKIQNILEKKLKTVFSQIDEILMREFKS
ncbi:MAG: HsdM family class I SAM-dependent methyltransferase [Promethearchaeota archaeon]